MGYIEEARQWFREGTSTLKGKRSLALWHGWAVMEATKVQSVLALTASHIPTLLVQYGLTDRLLVHLPLLLYVATSATIACPCERSAYLPAYIGRLSAHTSQAMMGGLRGPGR